MNTLIIFAYIWLPGPLIFYMWVSLPGLMSIWSPDWSPPDQQRWHEQRTVQKRPGADTPFFILKDVLETPHWTVYSIIVLAWTAILFRHRHDQQQLKFTLFNTIVAVMLVMRCLGCFSGTLHLDDLADHKIIAHLPTNASSAFKGFLLHQMFSFEAWGRTWLGNIDELPDQSLWAAEPRWPLERDRKELNIPWRDIFLRLAHYHVIDGVLHVGWLRFGWAFDEGRPYTQYMNNEEVVVAVFWVLMAGWTCLKCRMRMTARTDQDVEEGCVEEGCVEEMELDVSTMSAVSISQ